MTDDERQYHSYCLAAAFLTIALEDGGVRQACEGAGHDPGDAQAIKESIEQIVTNLTSQAGHFGQRIKNY